LKLGPDLSIMLNIQYRMHPILSQFASNEFYGGQIKDGVVAKDLESEYELFRQCPIVLFDCKT
jgi:superfamily I DNA and/or RNA helicase